MTIRLLTLDDLDLWVAHMRLHQAESGTEGDLPYGPYNRTEEFDAEAARASAEKRWGTPIGTPGWRRAWGVLLESAGAVSVVGHVDLAGDELSTTLHRAHLGLGVDRAFRRQGWGRALMVVALEWARAQPWLSWVDLGVFAGNTHAQALYERLGFEIIGRTPDRFRVDGGVIDDISMALRVD